MQSVYLQRIMKKNTAKGYKKTKPKQTQFPKSQKMSANAFSQKDYENKTAFRPKKTNPNKPNFKAFCKKGGILMPSQKADPIIRRFPWKFSEHISSVAEESQTKTLYKIQEAPRPLQRKSGPML